MLTLTLTPQTILKEFLLIINSLVIGLGSLLDLVKSICLVHLDALYASIAIDLSLF